MVTVIKQGKLPEDVEYEVECYKCRTIFSFKAKEAEKVYDQRDGDFLSINCPICKNKVTRHL